MKHIVRKAYWNYEKEEIWLNEMSAKGMSLTDYSWCRYVFTETSNNEYVYRIELLEHLPTHAESISYLKFLEENGVECVATYMRWIFLRKKSSEGAFDIYSDIESKIKHYKRINVLWNTMMAMGFTVGLFNIIIGLINLNIFNQMAYFSVVNLILGGFLVVLGLLFLKLGSPVRKKIKGLQQEKAIRE
ncbi:DUF2812 domain-containing protein [Clostridium estertheticum]|uniref:DUF2812 domain-containing protein n=1 Tax=Clostridium estertheticum TaxID=238834 RepID=UPI001CF56203|nr:DUF2812 domain-containing protein [Clostridium estertheticum]MCB2362107.1 DUF2812 domain-containing protein [Clostridium estertheticum]